MNPLSQFGQTIADAGPILALAPMQDITDWPFLALMSKYGGANLYFTEYFRVHSTSNLDRTILRSITENPTGRPIVAQLIGNDIPALVRTARELQKYPIAGVDLNLGCPAPVVYKKCAGGGLLREPERINAILGALRDATACPFTVKTRVGFDSPALFDDLLDVFSRHRLDLLTVHGRTVKQMYQPGVHYPLIARAAAALPFPVLANGDIFSASQAMTVLETTRVAGLMIGRGAIRNPWLFTQIGQTMRGEDVVQPTGRDLLGYIQQLYEAVEPPGSVEIAQVQKMKKYLNFIGLGVGSGDFLFQIRRVNRKDEFFRVCHTFLDHAVVLGDERWTGESNPRKGEIVECEPAQVSTA